MVRGPSSGHEHGKSGGGAVFAAERNLVDGSVGARRVSRGYVSICVAAILGAVARGAAQDLSTADDDRRRVSSGCETEFVVFQRGGTGRTHIYWRDTPIPFS